MEQYMDAIRCYQPWMQHFNRHEYQKVLSAYAAQYEMLFTDLVRRDKTPADMAKCIMDELASDWSALPFWKRGRLREEQKMMIVTFFSPMLLAAQEPLCGELAHALCSEWSMRWPRETYTIAERDTIQKGFRDTVLGINLEKVFFKKS